jgi:hypothetical protein
LGIVASTRLFLASKDEENAKNLQIITVAAVQCNNRKIYNPATYYQEDLGRTRSFQSRGIRNNVVKTPQSQPAVSMAASNVPAAISSPGRLDIRAQLGFIYLSRGVHFSFMHWVFLTTWQRSWACPQRDRPPRRGVNPTSSSSAIFINHELHKSLVGNLSYPCCIAAQLHRNCTRVLPKPRACYRARTLMRLSCGAGLTSPVLGKATRVFTLFLAPNCLTVKDMWRLDDELTGCHFSNIPVAGSARHS